MDELEIAQLANPELIPEAALRALRIQQARANGVPPEIPQPPTPQNTIIPPMGPSNVPPIGPNGETTKTNQVAGAPFPVAPGAPYARVLPPTPAGGVDASAVPPGFLQATGLGGPNVGLPRPGSVVEADPAWRQQWDAARLQDNKNPTIAALGGAQYGAPGALPTYQQAAQRIPGLTPTEYAHLLGTGGQLQAGQQDIGLRTAGLFGVGGTPGSLQNNAATVAQQGRAAEIQHGPDSQLAAAYQTFVNQRVASGGTLEDAKREWQQSGMSVPQFAGGTPLSGILPGAVNTAPDGTPTVHGNPPSTPGQSTEGRLNQIYNTVNKRQQSMVASGARNAADPITDFVSSLGDKFLQDNAKDVMKFMTDRFGGPAVDSWFTSRGSYFGPTTPQQSAIQAIQRAANRVTPGTVGSSAVNPQTPIGQAIMSTPAAMFLPHE